VAEPRGIRNHNPGNIRHTGVAWLGQADEQTDPSFVVFKSPVYGIRAIVRIMHSYQLLGINTIRGVISRWAPSTENDTNAYINSVCKDCGVQPDEKVYLNQIMPLLVKAIILHENGQQPYSEETIGEAIRLAA
jgi:hypothetical protein